MSSFQKKERFIVNLIFYGLIGALLFVGAKYLLPVLMPFLLALVVTLLLQPLIRLVAKNAPKFKRAVALLLCAVFYIICAYLVVNFGVQLFQKVGDMIAHIPALYESYIVPAMWMIYARVNEFVENIDPSLTKEIDAIFMDLLQNMRLYITEYSMKGVGLLTNTLTMIPGLLLKVLITIVSTFFIVADYDYLRKQAVRFIPQEKRPTVETAIGYVKNTIGKYVKSYSLIFFITFFELAIGFSLLRVQNAMLLGLLVAIFDILPILGTGGVLIPWALISAVLGDKAFALGVFTLYIIIIVVRNIIEPRIVGKQIGLHPLVTLVCMFVGLKFFGVIGLFGFPIALSVLVNMDRNNIIHLFPPEEAETTTPDTINN